MFIIFHFKINGLSNTTYPTDQRSMSNATTSSISSSGIVPVTNVVPISYNNNLTTSFADTVDILSVNNQRTKQIYGTPSEMIGSDERFCFSIFLSFKSIIPFKNFWSVRGKFLFPFFLQVCALSESCWRE